MKKKNYSLYVAQVRDFVENGVLAKWNLYMSGLSEHEAYEERKQKMSTIGNLVYFRMVQEG